MKNKVKLGLIILIMVELQGGSYSLTIVPTDTNATVSILDNNINVTSALEYEQGQDKYGNKVVNYKYKLTNIIATHNLVISCSSGSAKLYFENNNSWVQAKKAYIKINNSWVEQSNLENVFDSRINYIKGN